MIDSAAPAEIKSTLLPPVKPPTPEETPASLIPERVFTRVYNELEIGTKPARPFLKQIAEAKILEGLLVSLTETKDQPKLKGERLMLWGGKTPAVLIEPGVSIEVTATPNFDWTSNGITPEEVANRIRESSPFSVDVKQSEKGEANITLELKPITLEETVATSTESGKTPDRFIDDVVTQQFKEELSLEMPHELVNWVKEFVGGLELPSSPTEKVQTIYNALLERLRENRGAVNQLLIDYLTTLPPQKRLIFHKTDKPICQHLASLLSFCFNCAGISARSTRFYEQGDDFARSFLRKEPQGLLVIKDADGIKGIDTIAMQATSSAQDSVHAWTEAVINGYLVPFDITLDVDHPEREPMFCGSLPPVEIPKSLAGKYPEGKLYHVYPLNVPWAKITQVEEKA